MMLVREEQPAEQNLKGEMMAIQGKEAWSRESFWFGNKHQGNFVGAAGAVVVTVALAD